MSNTCTIHGSSRQSPVLDVQNLSVAFSGRKTRRTVLSNVSFSIYPGETVALVGESGSGKSVTALSLLRLIEQSGGVISGASYFTDTDGQMVNILSQSQRELRDIRGNKISMIFQEPMTSLNPVLSIGFQITEAILAHRKVPVEEAKKEAIDLLHKVEIPDPERRFGDYPHQFSGGMRQRVMIAMALACKPSLLIADEPTTALDVTTQARILDIIQRLKEEMGMAVLFITHDLGIVSEIADRVMVMYCGSIIEKSTTWELFTAPSHPYTSGLLLSMPAVGSARGKGIPLPTIPGTVPALWQEKGGCTFSPRCSYAMERCRHETPLLRRISPHSLVEVACHRAAEIHSALRSLLPWSEQLGITA